MAFEKKERPLIIEGKNRKGEIVPVRKHVINEGKAGIREITQGKVQVLQVDTPEYQERVETLHRYLLDGLDSEEAYAMMLMDNEDLGRDAFNILLHHAYTLAETELHKDREYVFQLHMDRYEKMYEQAMVMTNFWGIPLDPKKDWKQMVMKYTSALRALKAKEDLLGLHNKSVVIEFNDGQATIVNDGNDRGTAGGVPGYDLDNLSLDEKIEMLKLIQDSRTVPIEGIQRVVVKTYKVEINTQTGERKEVHNAQNIDKVETHDITFEEMPPDTVGKFQKIPDPEQEQEINLGPTIIDNTPKQQPKTAEEIQQMIRDRLQGHLKEKLKQKLTNR